MIMTTNRHMPVLQQCNQQYKKGRSFVLHFTCNIYSLHVSANWQVILTSVTIHTAMCSLLLISVVYVWVILLNLLKFSLFAWVNGV
jgi:hypothetical protein